MLCKVHESPYQACETRPCTFHTCCVCCKHFPGVYFNLGKLFMSQVLISSARRCLAERLWAHCKRPRKILFYAGHLYSEGFSWQRMDPNSRVSKSLTWRKICISWHVQNPLPLSLSAEWTTTAHQKTSCKESLQWLNITLLAVYCFKRV